MKTFKTFAFFFILLFSCYLLQAQNTESPKKLYHVLLFQWSDNLDVNAKAEIISLFKGLPAKVDGFEEINIIDLTMSTDDFDTVIIQTFSSENALEYYKNHADHQRIIEIGPTLLNRIANSTIGNKILKMG
jgi:hypothetical protein